VDDQEETCQYFFQIWAEAVVRQVERVREVRERDRRLFRSYEQMDGIYSPGELDLAKSARAVWSEEHTLVWAAYQVERWSQRLAEERCDDPPPRDEGLANVRKRA
jgi:hypothetical protein